MAENAVEYEPVSVPANREIYRGLARFGPLQRGFCAQFRREFRGIMAQ